MDCKAGCGEGPTSGMKASATEMSPTKLGTRSWPILYRIRRHMASAWQQLRHGISPRSIDSHQPCPCVRSHHPSAYVAESGRQMGAGVGGGGGVNKKQDKQLIGLRVGGRDGGGRGGYR